MIHDVQLPVADRETYVLHLERVRERENKSERVRESWLQWVEDGQQRKWMMGISLGKPLFFQLRTDVEPLLPPAPPQLLTSSPPHKL